ncbi:hypothetical protein BAUCODRAFT_77718 [Baudoinia panamericana UAMH 10762]|uniref:Orotidine 5'-phosphate decarboxylase n=1 Tax=Baudoinia panamericana (strain UAMH 10762) TaxID=717646 RepID=M2M7H3_BAUPA|nr:uncharacterized protein BAUCODRAFT_77718 [Baudoinia panamericana UAMH 10762]EMC92271.1 hypothetical protein BAUCODRAFT_77718 [Baudoinia panamericana UAMH 10762]
MLSTAQRHSSSSKTYGERSEDPDLTPLAQYLLRLIHLKQTNLCVSADVHTTLELLQLAEDVGDYICVLKTHADIIDDFGDKTIRGLNEVSRRKKFLIFEDRKFGDIGSTLQHQYTRGPLAIVKWASIVNAALFPGPAVIPALADAARRAILAHNTSMAELGPPPYFRALLLLAQMSSAGNLFTPEYTQQCLHHARQNKNFVMGFIAQQSLNKEADDNFITMTPGVQLSAGGDSMGQQYNTPQKVIGEQCSDIIIVGRGILAARDRRRAAHEYRKQGWLAYQERVRSARKKR